MVAFFLPSAVTAVFVVVVVVVVGTAGAVDCSDEEIEVAVAVEEVEEVDAEDMDEVDRAASVGGCSTALAPRSDGWTATTLSSSTFFNLAETVLCLFVDRLVKKAKGARSRLGCR